MDLRYLSNYSIQREMQSLSHLADFQIEVKLSEEHFKQKDYCLAKVKMD